jgi:Protein of unknown function DUF262
MSTLSNSDVEALQQKSKERTVRTQNIEYGIETLIKKIDDGEIRLDPEYQRNHRWSDKMSSKLIESLVLNIPVPLIYISYDVDVDVELATEDIRYSVIDGQQRIRAMMGYFNGEYALEGLDTLSEINGLKFNELPPFLQRRLNARTIRCLQVDSTVDEQVKYDIFERLNIGSVKLEAQEIRNATIRGYINDRLKELSLNDEFSKLIQIKNDKNRNDNTRVIKMEDRELVLRFLALSENYESEEISVGMGKFLTHRMLAFESYEDQRIDQMGDEFIEVMKIAKRDFGETAFAKIKTKGQKVSFASRFNVAVYDALSQAIKINLKQGIKEYSPNKKKKFTDLFNDSDFIETVSGNMNHRSKIKKRIETTLKAIK